MHVVACLALVLAVLEGAIAACVYPRTDSWKLPALRLFENRRRPEEVAEALNQIVELELVGQNAAVRAVRNALQDFKHLGVSRGGIQSSLVFNFVGPRGTGKTLLASIVARSLFDDCDSLLEDVKGFMQRATSSFSARLHGLLTPSANPGLFSRSCLGKTDGRLEHWWQACGVVYEGMAKGRSNSLEFLKKFMETAARELEEEPFSVIIVDDFDMCGNECSEFLKVLMNTQMLKTADGREVSASRATWIFISDLTDMGLTLESGDKHYESNIRKVQELAKVQWGGDSSFLKFSVLVPFAPLTDEDSIEVFSRMIKSFDVIVKKRIKLFQKGQDYKWDGRFICEKKVLSEILDHLRFKKESYNARTAEDVYHALLGALNYPKRIETLLEFKRIDNLYISKQDINVVVDQSSDELLIQLEVLS